MALIPPFFLDCVVAIGFVTEDEVRYAATGFLVGHLVADAPEVQNRKYRLYLVTNRHVFKGHNVAKLRFNPSGSLPAKIYDLPLVDVDGKPQYQGYPDESVDVAVQSINVELLQKDGIQFSFFASDLHILPFTKAVDEGLSEGDSVFVLGFPLGQVGKERNYVIVRQGTIARVRDALAGSSPDFLLDASIFPGNSGGPVVTRPEAMAITGTKSLSKAWLIGVVSGYVPYQDVAISVQTNRPRVIFEENSGMAAVIPIDRALDAIGVVEAKLAPAPATAAGSSTAAV
jgi:S1-C subfamily serine protease